MNDRTESPKDEHFAHHPGTGVRVYVGPSEEPTVEQRAEYERQLEERAARKEQG